MIVDNEKLNIYLPSKETGFVEYGRCFCVQAQYLCENPIPDNSDVSIQLFDDLGNLVRKCFSNIKNQSINAYYPELTAYEERLDPSRIKLQEFGFPELINNNGNLKDGQSKCWYNDNTIKAIIISASDVGHGAIFDDGMNFTDDNNQPYDVLKPGIYVLKISVFKENEIDIAATKNIIIGYRENQLICRFNPDDHKQAMLKWADMMGFSIIDDLIPGYLEPYLGEWFYHMGLLKMYRANDICLYTHANIRLFVYLIDETSTSYQSELAYLQKNNVINSQRFYAYHYDLGEAIVKNHQSKILEFDENEYMYICRIDIVSDNTRENIYYVDEKNLVDSIFDLDDININAGYNIAIMGVMKPWQLDSEDFILKPDNTYEIKNSPHIMRYTFRANNDEQIIHRFSNMKRYHNDKYIGNSAYEFYNLFYIDKSLRGKTIDVLIENLDRKGRPTPAKAKLSFKVK